MRHLSAWFLGGLLLVAGSSAMQAQTLPAEGLRRQQQSQQQVRAMTRELVGSVIDVQLQQLRENGLTSNRLYADIGGMRDRLDSLIEAEMPEVVGLLAKIESAGPDERAKTYSAARDKSRAIVVRLLTERQFLLRRLKIAETDRQVQQVIEAQMKVLGATRALPEQPASRREALNLSALEDQRDVRALCDRLSEAFGESGREAGPPRTAAAAALKSLRENGISGDFSAAENYLQEASFAKAAGSQRAVIRKLETLLSQIRMAEGIKAPNQSDTVQRIRDLSERQERLRDVTTRADLSQPESENLVGQQVEIRKQIDNLQESLSNQPEVQRLLQTAQQPASDAAADLFDQQKQRALTTQGDVVRKLDDAAGQAEREDVADSVQPTADQLKQKINDLEKAANELLQADQQQKQLSEVSKEDFLGAGQQEQQVDEHLINARKPRILPAHVRSRVDEARQAVKEAGAHINRDEWRHPSVQTANDAVERALSEALTALADARREQLLAMIKELSTAAEALDEARETERSVAQDTHQAAEKIGESANDIRQEIQNAADELEKLAKSQWSQVDAARKNVEKELARSLQQRDAADMNQQAANAGHLAEQTVPFDADATALLRNVQQAAAESTRAQAGGAQTDVQEDLGEAAASLAAREQQIGQDIAKGRAKVRRGQQTLNPSSIPQPSATPPAETAGNSPAVVSDMRSEGPTTSTFVGNAPDAEPTAVKRPWIAKLPPELRNAIRNNAQQRPPRGYEERLQEYFQTVD